MRISVADDDEWNRWDRAARANLFGAGDDEDFLRKRLPIVCEREWNPSDPEVFAF